jgi:hypothetical protein
VLRSAALLEGAAEAVAGALMPGQDAGETGAGVRAREETPS